MSPDAGVLIDDFVVTMRVTQDGVRTKVSTHARTMPAHRRQMRRAVQRIQRAWKMTHRDGETGIPLPVRGETSLRAHAFTSDPSLSGTGKSSSGVMFSARASFT